MRPLSPRLVAFPLAAFGALACRNTPMDPIHETASLASVASANGVELCLASPGVTQHVADGKIVVIGTNGGDAVACMYASLPVSVHALGGNDIVVGSAFDDDLDGGPGNDRVHGGPGNDGPSNAGGCMIPDAAPYRGYGIYLPAQGALFGGLGDDLLEGGPGDDALTGQEGTDICEGGPGTDDLVSTCEVQDQGPTRI